MFGDITDGDFKFNEPGARVRVYRGHKPGDAFNGDPLRSWCRFHVVVNGCPLTVVTCGDVKAGEIAVSIVNACGYFYGTDSKQCEFRREFPHNMREAFTGEQDEGPDRE